MISSNRSHLHVSAATHPGMRGKNNEDGYAVSAHRLSAQDHTPSVLALVCDGIGGHQAGEVASQISVETISTIVSASDGSQPMATMQEAIVTAGQKIHEQSVANPAQKGMGSTCVCAWVIGRRLYTASVGDSRLFLVRGDSIRQLSTDHTWIQEAIEFGALTPEQARNHPNAHVIRRYLGSAKPVEVDFRLRLDPAETNEQAEANQGMQLLQGDFLILCSDGLTDLVEKEEILATVKSQPRERAVHSLIDLANQRGGHDNITIIVMQVPPSVSKTKPLPARKKPSKKRSTSVAMWVGILGALFGLAIVIAAAAWYITRPVPVHTETPTLTTPAEEISPPVVPDVSTTETPMPEVLPSPEPSETLPLPTASPTFTSTPAQATATPTLTSWPTSTLTQTAEPTQTPTETATQTPP